MQMLSDPDDPKNWTAKQYRVGMLRDWEKNDAQDMRPLRKEEVLRDDLESQRELRVRCCAASKRSTSGTLPSTTLYEILESGK